MWSKESCICHTKLIVKRAGFRVHVWANCQADPSKLTYPRLSCSSGPIPEVLTQPYCHGCPIPGCPAVVVMFRPSFPPGCPALALFSQTHLSQMSCPDCSVIAVPWWLSQHGCTSHPGYHIPPVPVFLSLPSCSGHLPLSFLSYLYRHDCSWLSCRGFPVPAIFLQLSFVSPKRLAQIYADFVANFANYHKLFLQNLKINICKMFHTEFCLFSVWSKKKFLLLFVSK